MAAPTQARPQQDPNDLQPPLPELEPPSVPELPVPPSVPELPAIPEEEDKPDGNGPGAKPEQLPEQLVPEPQLPEEPGVPSRVRPPEAWTCPPETYHAGDGCHCQCGVQDPDCNEPSATLHGCPPGSSCVAGLCLAAFPGIPLPSPGPAFNGTDQQGAEDGPETLDEVPGDDDGAAGPQADQEGAEDEEEETLEKVITDVNDGWRRSNPPLLEIVDFSDAIEEEDEQIRGTLQDVVDNAFQDRCFPWDRRTTRTVRPPPRVAQGEPAPRPRLAFVIAGASVPAGDATARTGRPAGGAGPAASARSRIDARLQELGIRTPPACRGGGGGGRRLLAPGGDDDFAVVDFRSRTAGDLLVDWNPFSRDNDWPRDADDGTAAYLAAFVDGEVRTKMYVNFVHHIRLQNEALEETEARTMRVEAVFFSHGSAAYPADAAWAELADAHTRLFRQLREDLGHSDMPIVDFAGSTRDTVHTARAAAAAAVGNVKVVHFPVGTAEAAPAPAGEGCLPGQAGLCGRVPMDLQLLLGHDACDPLVGEQEKRTFEWRASCEAGAGLGTDAEMLVGEMMADAYILSLGRETGTVSASFSSASFSYREVELVEDELDCPVKASSTLPACAGPEEIAERGLSSWCWRDERRADVVAVVGEGGAVEVPGP